MKEQPLELTAAPFVLRVDFVEEQPQAGHTPPSSSAPDLIPELRVPHETFRFGLAKQLSQPPRRQQRSLVEERSGDRGARDAAKARSVLRRQPAIAVSPDPGRAAAAAVRSRDVKLVIFRNSPVSRRRSMGKDGAGAAGEDGGHANPVDGEARMPYRKNTPVDAVEPPGPNSGGSRAPVHSKPFQLSEGHEAVLLVCQRRDVEVPAPWPPSAGRIVEILATMGRTV